MVGHDVVDLQHGRKDAADDRGHQLLPVGVPEINGRALGPGDLPGAGDDDAQEMLPVDLLGEGLAQVVEEVVDDLLLLLQRDEFLLQLGLQSRRLARSCLRT